MKYEKKKPYVPPKRKFTPGDKVRHSYSRVNEYRVIRYEGDSKIWLKPWQDDRGYETWSMESELTLIQ